MRNSDLTYGHDFMIAQFGWLRNKLLWQDPLADIAPNPQAFHEAMTRKPASRRYAILFTARSSSTRLYAAASGTGQLGVPREWFRPDFSKLIAGRLGATSLGKYVQVLSRVHTSGNLFGAELTWRHIQSTFGTPQRFRALVAPDEYVGLLRRDIVTQAVSVLRFRQTGIAHSPTTANDTIRIGDDRFQYDSKKIAHWINILTQQEAAIETYFQQFNIQPLRLSYEQLSRMTDPQVAMTLADHLQVNLKSDLPIKTGHIKLGDEKSLDFATRFRAENDGFMADIDQKRMPLLAQYPE